jgi:putative phosphoesterase
MLVGIIADTHDNAVAVDAAVRVFRERRVSLVVHAGDIVAPFTVRHFEPLGVPMRMVFGNNDGERLLLRERAAPLGGIHVPPFQFTVETEGRRRSFVVFHEPLFIEDIAREETFDFVVYGHTHRRDVRMVGASLVINPGEAGGWVTGERSVALLDTATNRVEFVVL